MKLLNHIMLALAIVAAPIPAAADGVRETWRQTWRSFGVDPAVAESVVWPEMLRYNVIRDLAETAADYGFYVLGEESPDYSIGIFQMRPSFVEDLEKAWMRSGLAEAYNLPFDISDSPASRSNRIGRMSSEDWQAVYVGIFLRMLYHSYGLDALSAEEHVRLAATAYNRGCAWTEAGRGNVESLRKNAGAKYASRAWEHYKTIVGE